MKKIITYGTFDILHKGHINILKRAKELGDYLIVAISSDNFNKIKGKKSFYSYEERKYLLEAIKYVEEIIPVLDAQKKVVGVLKSDGNSFIS